MSRTFTEEEIQDLTDRVFELTEQLKQGKMKFAPHLVNDFIRSFEAVRLRPDGRVDPNTVDGQIRAMTLAIRAMKWREDLKSKVTIEQIQEYYFEQLFHQFGNVYEKAKEAGATPAVAAQIFANDDDFVNHAIASLPDYGQAIKEFWEAVAEAGLYHLQDGRQLKASFGGDIFPAHWENAVSTAGLYVDTIVLPCPILRIVPLVGIYPARKVVELLLKHVLTAMEYREAAMADVDIPIVVILPSSSDIHPEDQDLLRDLAAPSVLKHASYLFGREFESIEHLLDFCKDLPTAERVLQELKGKDRVVFDSEWGSSAEEQIAQVLVTGNPGVPGADPRHAGAHIAGLCVGRLTQALGLQRNAIERQGAPLVMVDTSWRYYTWLLEYQSLNVNQIPELASLHVARALMSERTTNLDWLGNVPVSTVIDIRKNGLADEVRSILGSGIGQLISQNPANFFRTADKVVENLNEAFQKHSQALREAKIQKLKLYGLDVGSVLVTGTIGVAGAITGNPTLGAVGAVLGLAGLPNLKDIKTRWKDIIEQDKAYRSSPTGLLFQHIRERKR